MRQVSGTELFPYFYEFMVTMGTKFGYNSLIKVVLKEVYITQKLESLNLDE